MLFSIIIVSLNAGKELGKTLESVLKQKYGDFEVLIKDGCSTDGCTEGLQADERVRLVVRKDRHIYDAMNQAIQEVKGRYLLFLNCGDYLYDEMVLWKVAGEMARHPADIYYGDLYRRVQDSTDVAPDALTDFGCFRNVPNHQVCFYDRKLFAERGYDLQYPVRADYEHFLYCIYVRQARTRHMHLTVTSYAGGGYSERKESEAAGKKEHKRITDQYLKAKAVWYRLVMILTLQPLRKRMADSPYFSAIYHKIKARIYRRK